MGLENVRIVLCETSHPGNIGAAARAMKNMGLADLALVNPAQFPHAEATARASGADDLLMSARVVSHLEEAVADCRLVLGASARERSLSWPMTDAREGARRLYDEGGAGRVAVVFGNEQSGLSNRELDRCQALLKIPTSDEYSSLNLAQAVQVVTYELRMAALSERNNPSPSTHTSDVPLARAQDLERFYAHLEALLIRTRFLDPGNPRHLMRRLRRLFARAGLDENEVNILRGMLSQFEKHFRNED